MRGQFIITPPDGNKIILPNTIVAEGAEDYLGEIFQNAGLGTFYVGLCNQVPDNADVLADITTEPTIGIGAYARQPLARNTTDWPSITTQNGESYATSKQITFTATGADFDAAHSRLFLCSVLTGFVGTLFAYSAALPTAMTITDGNSWDAQYQFFLN